MIAAGSHALELALALWRVPSRVAQAQRRRLPPDLKLLIQLAAGDEELAARCAEASGETPQVVQEAAVFYLQQVLFAPGADSYRVLGVSPDAPDELIKQHYRWLVRWLHPDRNPDEWEGVYADRVNRAWQDLRQPARRAEYDQRRAASAAPAPPTPTAQQEDDWGDAAPRPASGVDVGALEAPAPVRRGAAVLVLPVLAVAVLSAGAWFAWPVLQDGVLTADATAPATHADTPEAPAAPPLPMVEGAGDAPTAAMAAAAIAQRNAAQDVGGAGEPALELIRVPPETAPVPKPVPLEVAPAPSSGEGIAARAQPPRGTTDPEALRAKPTPAPVLAPAPVRSAPDTPSPAPSPARTSALARAPAAATPPPAHAAAVADAAPATPLRDGPTPPPEARGAALPDAAPTQAEVEALLVRFRRAYAEGDINALMQLFARDARNNRGGRDAIVYDYQSLFAGSESRSLALEELDWVPGRRITTVNARFLAEVKRPGRWRATRSRGDIRFDIGREDGQPRITMIWHDND